MRVLLAAAEEGWTNVILFNATERIYNSKYHSAVLVALEKQLTVGDFWVYDSGKFSREAADFQKVGKALA